MRASKPALVLAVAVALGGWAVPSRAQLPVGPPPPDEVLSTRFLAPLTYQAALARLDSYYDEQLGRRLPAALPEIAPHCHFEVWHDMWVFFDAANGQTTVTLKRLTEGISSRLAKGWMLDLAGRLDAPMPLDFKEEPPLHETSGEIYASRSDLARALSETSMKPVATWQHAGLLVSAAPLAWVVLAPTGPHGVRRVTVAAETAAAAKQLVAKLMQGVLKPGIFAVYSEETEIDQEVRGLANGKSFELGSPNVDEKYMEDKLRAEPEMVKRTAAAQGQYTIRFRVDKSYRRVTVSWTELTGYARATGKFETERALGQSALPGPKPSPQAPLTAHTKLPVLKPGAYRIRLESEDAAGQSAPIDQRTYWFDGKIFEEL